MSIKDNSIAEGFSKHLKLAISRGCDPSKVNYMVVAKFLN